MTCKQWFHIDNFINCPFCMLLWGRQSTSFMAIWPGPVSRKCLQLSYCSVINCITREVNKCAHPGSNPAGGEVSASYQPTDFSQVLGKAGAGQGIRLAGEKQESVPCCKARALGPDVSDVMEQLLMFPFAEAQPGWTVLLHSFVRHDLQKVIPYRQFY